jgi:hypothetical protein
MAIRAGAIQNCPNFLWHLHMRFKESRGDRGWVRASRLHELYGDQKYQQGEKHLFHPGHVHSTISSFGVSHIVGAEPWAISTLQQCTVVIVFV